MSEHVLGRPQFALKIAPLCVDPFLLKIAPSHGEFMSDTWFLEPTGVHLLNSISISSAVFAGITIVINRPSDRQTDRLLYSVGSNTPHPASAAICGLIVSDKNRGHGS